MTLVPLEAFGGFERFLAEDDAGNRLGSLVHAPGADWEALNPEGRRVGRYSDRQAAADALAGEDTAVQVSDQPAPPPVPRLDLRGDIEELAIAAINLDGGTQMRSYTDVMAVAEYAEAMEAGAQFPAVNVTRDAEGNCWLTDGFHRVAAAKKLGWEKIRAYVRPGSQRDAVLAAVGANATHGLRRTNFDKRHSVEVLLADPEWGRWSDREIGRLAGVDGKTVASVRRVLAQIAANRAEEERLAAERRTKNGRVMNTANIGAKPAGAGEKAAAAPGGPVHVDEETGEVTPAPEPAITLRDLEARLTAAADLSLTPGSVRLDVRVDPDWAALALRVPGRNQGRETAADRVAKVARFVRAAATETLLLHRAGRPLPQDATPSYSVLDNPSNSGYLSIYVRLEPDHLLVTGSRPAGHADGHPDGYDARDDSYTRQLIADLAGDGRYGRDGHAEVLDAVETVAALLRVPHLRAYATRPLEEA